MIYIPTEVANDAVISGVVLTLGAAISIIFKQSKTVSIFIAKILVMVAMRILNAGDKWSKTHTEDIKRLESEWHLLKVKLKGDKIGLA